MGEVSFSLSPLILITTLRSRCFYCSHFHRRAWKPREMKYIAEMMWVMISGEQDLFAAQEGLFLSQSLLLQAARLGCQTVHGSGLWFSLVLGISRCCQFCFFMDFQGVLIRNQGRVSQTPLVCCRDGLDVS